MNEVCFCLGVSDSCLSSGAGVRDRAGMHGPTGSSTDLGQCGEMEELSPRQSPAMQYLQLQFDKHIQLAQVGSDAEQGGGGTAAVAGRAVQHNQRLAVPFRHSSAPHSMVKLICCYHAWCQQGYLGWWLSEVDWAPCCVPAFV